MPSSANRSGLAPDRLLEAWALYRIGIAGALAWLISSPWRPPALADDRLPWLLPFLLLYLLCGALFLLANRSQRLPLLAIVLGHLLCDFVASAVTIYAGGGLSSGLGSLFLLPVALGSLFLPRTATPVPAAIASLLLLGIEFQLSIGVENYRPNWPQAGLLGALLFLISMLGGYIAQRSRLDENIARSAASNLGQLRKLAAEVVERMQAAVLVCDSDGRTLLQNAASLKLLSHEHDRRPIPLREPKLWEALQRFRVAPEKAQFEAIELSTQRKAWPQFVVLPGEQELVLIVIDDPERIAQQMQQTRLAAIGQVTAGVAHDIRNPLAALSNAAQLLSEDPTVDTTSLLAVIRRQSHRINRVVERIYQLARPFQPRAEKVQIVDFLRQLLEDLGTTESDSQQAIELDCEQDLPPVFVDPDQLAECLHNLVENSCKHACPPETEALKIRISARRGPDTIKLFFWDNGKNPAVSSDGDLFDAFRGSGGMGIGLYLCRELLRANRATIILQSGPDDGTCFEITLPIRDQQ